MTTSMGGDATSGLDGGSQQGERLQGAASGLVDQAARTAEAQASTTMTKVGETLDQVANAIREAGSNLRETQPEIANVVDTAAQRVQDASTYLRDHDAGETLENVQRFARQQPAAIVGGGLALGLLLGRLLRSGTAGQPQGQGGMDRYGSTGYGSTGYGATGYGATGYGATGYGGSTGYVAGATDYGSSGYAGTSDYGTGSGIGATGAGVTGGIAATDTLGDTAGSSFGAGTSGASELGMDSDTGLSNDFTTTDTQSVSTDDILGDDGVTDLERGR